MQFTKALEVTHGDPVTSRQHNALAAAFNDRMRSGAGDPTWRLWWRAHSLVRYLCEDEGFSVKAPVDDYWRYWNLVDPRANGEIFNCAMGYRKANPLVLFNRGNLDEDLGWYPGEGPIVNYAGAADVTTAEQAWLAAMFQRGGVTESNNYLAPAREAAIQHRYLSWIGGSVPFNKSWGGFIAGPARGMDLDMCWEGFTEYSPAEYIFTALKPGLPDLKFAPVCPGQPDEGDNAIAVDYFWDRYVVWFHNGGTRFLPYSDYTEGPYTRGGEPYWSHGDILIAMANQFSGEFKGSHDQQKAEGYDVYDYGFDFQAFLTRQYKLAPAYMDGQEVVYPTFHWLEHLRADGQEAICSEGGNLYAVHDGFVFAGFFAKADNLPAGGSATFKILNDGVPMLTVTLTDTSPTQLYWFPQCVQARVTVKLVGALAPDPAQVTVTMAELQDYKPSMEDAYLVLRACTATGDELRNVDTTGYDYGQSRELWKQFNEWGCLVNANTLQVDPQLETNPIFDVARRWFQKNLRFVARESFGNATLISYAVEDGKTVLRFNRYCYYGGEKLDMFKNIAPPDTSIPSGELKAGLQYVVRNASVIHNKVTYSDGRKFTAVAATYTPSVEGSTPEVFQVDGIIPTATPASESNEWLMFLSTNVYREADGSEWKPDGFGDIVSFLGNRCLFGEGRLSQYDIEDLWRHMTNSNSNLQVEAPSGWNYVQSAHRYVNTHLNGNADADFFKSCPIYKPDYEIESITDEGADHSVVVVKFKSRFQSTSAAPAAISRDMSTWDYEGGSGKLLEGGAAPAYRTDENALREYLIDQERGSVCRLVKGDQSSSSWLSGNFDGSCHPRFYFTRLVPKVRVDEPADNDTVEKSDSLCVADRFGWMHFILAAMCEGYVDQTSEAKDGCPNQKLGDYTLHSLMWQVNTDDRTEQLLTTLTIAWIDQNGPFDIERGPAEEPWPVYASSGASPWQLPTGGSDSTWRVRNVLGSIVDSEKQIAWDEGIEGPFLIQRQDSYDINGEDRYLYWTTVETTFEHGWTIPDTNIYRVVRVGKGKRWWFYPVSTEARDNPPWSQGPVSNTIMYAQVFNQFAKALNKLTRLRIELPLGVLSQELTFEELNTLKPTQSGFTKCVGEIPVGGCCSDLSNDCFNGEQPFPSGGKAYLNAGGNDNDVALGPPEGETASEVPTVTGAWVSLPAGHSRQCQRACGFWLGSGQNENNSWFTHKCDCNDEGERYPVFRGTATKYRLKIDPSSPALDALPADLRSLLEAKPSFQIATTMRKDWIEEDANLEHGQECGQEYTHQYWDSIKFIPRTEESKECEIVTYDELASGEGVLVDIDRLREGYMWMWRTGVIHSLTYLCCWNGPQNIKTFTVSPNNMSVTVPLVAP